MQRCRVLRASGLARDFDLIEEHLFNTYVGFGDDPETATQRTGTRIGEALGYLRSFERHPHRGSEHPQIRPGLRTVTSRNFIFYFEIDEAQGEVRILAVFFGGADHRRQILDRLRD